MGIVTVGVTWAESDGVTVDMTGVESDNDTVDRVEAVGRDGITTDAGPLLLMGGGRGFVTLAGLMDAVERDGRSGSV